jgi:hypothetical protein
MVPQYTNRPRASHRRCRFAAIYAILTP